MNNDYYLRPYNPLIKDNGDIKFKNIEILTFNSKEELIVQNTIDIKNNNIVNCKKIKNRIKNINNPSLPLSLSKANKPIIMGIVNITKDSFFDGNKFFKYKKALNHAEKLLQEGADIIDIGGESTRPGSFPIDVAEEIRRVIPVIKELVKNNILVSCDTRNSLTMQVALDSGVSIINDVSGLNYDKNTPNVLKGYNCLYVLMHSQGNPNVMQNNPIYNHVACDIYNFFKEKLLILKRMNISNKRIIIDPGIGFGKKDHHNYSILKNLSIFLDLGRPLMIGLSRKSFIKKFVDNNTLLPSVILASNSYFKGAKILRVHDVKETIETINIIKKVN